MDRDSRLAIAASLAWAVLAALAILGTHVDVVAQVGTGDAVEERMVEVAPPLAAPPGPTAGEC